VKPAPDVVQVVREPRHRALEQQDRADVHVRSRPLLVQERGVDRGETVEVLLRHVTSPAPTRSPARHPQRTLRSVSWDFCTEPAFAEQLEWMSRFVKERIWPLETLVDELGGDGLKRAVAPLQQEVKTRQLWAAHLQPELGGQGFGQVRLGLMHEILGSSPLGPLVFGNAPPDSGNAEILALVGTADQKRRYLHPLLAGDLSSAFSMTEPETAGSDPTLLRSTAVRDHDGWILNGHKWFSTNGSIADFLIVMAVTDPDARPHERASMFIVDADTPGVRIVRDVATMEHPNGGFGRFGNHAEIVYEDVRLREDSLLGRRGEGFVIAQQRLYPGRIHHCMRWLGVARRAFDMLCERSLYRYAHGSTLAGHQTVQNWIADSAAEMQASRLMTLHAAWKIDTQGVLAARSEIAMIKYFGAKVLHDVIDRALQAHGALGYSTDLPLEAMYRYARSARIYDGPDEVHRTSVARRVLRGYEPPPDALPREHIPTRREAARVQFAHLLEVASAND
jgi:acyl-CoA dehydrogenase